MENQEVNLKTLFLLYTHNSKKYLGMYLQFNYINIYIVLRKSKNKYLGKIKYFLIVFEEFRIFYRTLIDN